MEETISLQEILSLLKKKILIILVFIFIALGISAILTFFVITPKYSSTTQLIATAQESKTGTVTQDAVNTNLLMINTYKDFIKGNVVMEEATDILAKESGFKGTSKSLSEMISVEQTQNSQMFSIKATAENPVEAANMVNVVASVFQKEAKKYTSADKVSIISKGEVNEQPVSPNKTINLAIGVILGFIIGVGIALLSELFNRTVKSQEFVTETLGLPILAAVPSFDKRHMNQLKKTQISVMEEGNITFETDNVMRDISMEVDGLDRDLEFNDQTIDLSDINLSELTSEIKEDHEDSSRPPYRQLPSRRSR
ncbi:hypothetical protein CBF34_02685 [Vagococcus penaei]|uniref:Capsular polysaccharide biosynthesis protein CpsC n=1 Tax=Vagococcus penaei TaxID=633807 RepID=A0A1Q2D437_9ENTE|nr:Wzz/FepE/Etk N-terminal domain-containing protein [Vagococcus penaei]AQP53103.1 hypothetical protein BW732_01905 [Vagococcus penaei]RSU06035.1 hypothetical protein CBF34_02685 [Vagococcus penaei]